MNDKLKYPPADKYPCPREDWLMTAEYADKKSMFHCILCTKTHRIKDCPNKLTKIEADPKTKSMYDYNDEEYNPHNYGW